MGLFLIKKPTTPILTHFCHVHCNPIAMPCFALKFLRIWVPLLWHILWCAIRMCMHPLRHLKPKMLTNFHCIGRWKVGLASMMMSTQDLPTCWCLEMNAWRLKLAKNTVRITHDINWGHDIRALIHVHRWSFTQPHHQLLAFYFFWYLYQGFAKYLFMLFKSLILYPC